jgi:hypothetical protein
MEEVTLSVPERLVASLPEEDPAPRQDVERAVDGWERRINAAIRTASDDREATAAVVDAVERMQDRADRYDEFVPELRAWGQSPVYAMVWRDLYVDLVGQLYDDDDLAERIDRERNYRLVEDGVRLRDTKD